MSSSANIKEEIPSKFLKGTVPPMPFSERGQQSRFYIHPKDHNKIIFAGGRYIFVTDITSAKGGFVYNGHSQPTTVGRFSPSGNWVASGDIAGKVRVWAFDHEEKILKNEAMPFAGEVKDICWDPENKRICAVGDGSQTKCKCFMWDTGNSVGEMNGHSGRVNSVSYKQQRPYRIMTCGDDMRVQHYEGPPFKMKKSEKCHTNFANCIKHSPDGLLAVSVGSDKNVFYYDGKTGELQGKLEGPDCHKGTIYQVAFKDDGSQFATCSADKTVKVWDTASKACVATHQFGGDKPALEHMQVALDWKGDNLVSMSLGGQLNVIAGGAPPRTITGHQETVEAIGVHRESGKVITGAFNGKLFCLTDGVAADFPVSHSKRVSGIAVAGDTVFTTGWDDQLRIVQLNSLFDVASVSVTLPGQPAGVSACASLDKNTTTLVATLKGAVVVKDGKIAYTGPCPMWDPVSAAISPDGHLAAIGGKDNLVHLYNVDHASGALTEAGELQHRGGVTALAFSPDSTMLCAGDGNRAVIVWDCASKKTKINGWTFHGASICSVAWSPCGNFVASASLDSSIIVWSVHEPLKKEIIKLAHQGGVKCVKFLNGKEIVSTGADGCIKYWDVPAL